MGKPIKIITPIEKASELYKSFWRVTPQPYTVETVTTEHFKEVQFQDWDKDWTNRMAIESALICVEEILEATKLTQTNSNKLTYIYLDYWKNVKEELLKRKNNLT